MLNLPSGREASQQNRGFNWLRGLTRLYILLVVVWLGYWLLWVPLGIASDWRKLAAIADSPAEAKEFEAKGTLIHGWRELGRDLARSPLLSAFVIFGLPALGYLALRIAALIVGWVLQGFRRDPANEAHDG